MGNDNALNSGDGYIYDIPFNPMVVRIKIIDSNGKELKNINVAKYMKCGNGVCDNSENHSVCAIDCLSGGYDDYCDQMLDGFCDVDCIKSDKENDRDCNDLEKSKNKKRIIEFIKNQRSKK